MSITQYKLFIMIIINTIQVGLRVYFWRVYHPSTYFCKLRGESVCEQLNFCWFKFHYSILWSHLSNNKKVCFFFCKSIYMLFCLQFKFK